MAAKLAALITLSHHKPTMLTPATGLHSFSWETGVELLTLMDLEKMVDPNAKNSSGRILLAMGRGEEAAKLASFVAERWRGPDHDEALELWNTLPAEKRIGNSTIVEEVPANTKVVNGILTSVTCGEKSSQTSVVIEDANGKHTFRSKGEHMVGFSDTVWYGRDHFSFCHHLEGLRAIVRYKESQDKAIAGDWVELELREDVPVPLKQVNTAAGPKS